MIAERPSPRPAIRLALAAAVVIAAACDPLLGVFDSVRVFGVDTTFVAAPLDLDADPTRPAQAPPAEVDIDGLAYRAAIVVDSVDSFETHHRFAVDVRNPSADTVDLAVGGCTVRAEAYDNPQRSGEPVWAQETEGYQCVQAPYLRRIGPGETSRFSSHVETEALPDGRYYFRARFLLSEDTLWFDSGSTDIELNVPGLSYQVRVSSGMQRRVDASVRVTNESASTVTLTFGACPLSLALYRDPARSEQVGRWHRSILCPGLLYERELSPGSSLDPFEQDFLAGELDVPSGGYHLSVVLPHNGRRLDLPAGWVWVG